jgi:hypothetical protein
MKRRIGEDLANGAFRQPPAPLVALLDNPDIYSRPDVVSCTAVVLDAHWQVPERGPPWSVIAPDRDALQGISWCATVLYPLEGFL